jgi:hypothetical protein
LVDVFRTGRFKYLVTILIRTLSTAREPCLRLAFDILAALLSKSWPEPIKVDTTVFVTALSDPRYCFVSLSILARLQQHRPSYELVLALLDIAKQGELAAMLLCQYCDIEMVAVKMAEISGQWIMSQLPTLDHTLQIVLIITCHQRARPYLLHSPNTQQFLVGVLATRRAELIDAVGTIQMAFPLGSDLIQKMRQVQFLRQYIEAACALGRAPSMVQCLDLVKMLAKVGFDEDFLLLLPILKSFLSPAAGWHAPGVSLLATLSRHEHVRREIVQLNIVELVNAITSQEASLVKRIQKFRRNMGISRL